MSYDKLINDYFDGNLNESGQELLFNEIANNSETRSDFNQLFAIKHSIINDKHAFVPNPSTSEDLFTNLGINSDSEKSKKIGFWSLYKSNILVSLVSALATAIIMYLLLFDGKDYFRNKNSQVPIISSYYSSDKPYLEIEVPIDNETSDVNINTSQTRYMNEINKLNDRYNEIYNQMVLLEIQNDSLNSPKKNTPVPNNKETVNFAINEKSVFQSNFIIDPNHHNYSNKLNFTPLNVYKSKDKRNVKIEAAIGRYYQNISTDFLERNNAFTDNIRISGLYNLSEEYSMGLDLRQENFYQEFTDLDNNSQNILYQQQPTVYSASLIFRYSPDYLKFFEVSPNVDLTFGASNIGELARIGFGFDYNLFSNTYFYLKSDYTFLSFYHKDINFSSNKLGTHIGLGVEF
ncbi:MAG: hypothetical protein ACE364_08025 [Chlorobiota bacterium]